jgi:hypothetical protein
MPLHTTGFGGQRALLVGDGYEVETGEKVFCPDAADDIFELRGVNRATGCMVVVRPDQYVAHVLALDDHKALADFFASILIDAA